MTGITLRLFPVALLLTAVLSVTGQTGHVRVRVTDPLGARIFEAEVRFLDQDKKVVQIARSDRLGEVVLTNLPAGEGSVDINIPGFKRMIFVGVKTENENESAIDAKLQPGNMIVDYDGEGPLPIKQVRVRVRDTAGSPITTAHGWIAYAGMNPIVRSDERGELLFKVVPVYPGILIAADGYSAQLIQFASDKAQQQIDVILK